MFIPPMLASPYPDQRKNPRAKPFEFTPNAIVAEIKYDGQRIGMEIHDSKKTLLTETGVTAWTRFGNSEFVPKHILEILLKFPNCYLDGELMAPGKRSFGTMDHSNRDDLVYYVFDLLIWNDVDIMPLPRRARRRAMMDFLTKYCGIDGDELGPVRIAEERFINSFQEMEAYRDEVWEKDGEGLILKHQDAPYQLGKRSKFWTKVKKKQSAALTVVGFEESRGRINYRGKHAIVQLLDDDGFSCTVKTKNDAEITRFDFLSRTTEGPHPDLGRKLRIEFQERTPDGQYREPRWDRWEDE